LRTGRRARAGLPVLSDRTRRLIDLAKAFARNHFGGAGFRDNEAIADAVRWRPTFLIRPNMALTIAFEYSEILFPDVLSVAVTDLLNYGTPTKTYQICPLSIYLSDRNQTSSNRLRDRGIGLITVDEDTNAVALQFKAVPVTQNITPEDITEALKPIPATWRVLFRAAFDTYISSEVQGLQQASQIIEAIIRGYHSAAAKHGLVKPPAPAASAASLVDDLYASPKCIRARNLFGGLRAYLDEYRNVSSHPTNTAKAATTRIKKCRRGILEACRLAGQAAAAAKASKPRLTIRISLTA
jgi:hypothetical protein